MNIMINERGYQSALSACPEPGAAFVAAQPTGVRLRGAGVAERPHLGVAAAAPSGIGLPAACSDQGTGLPVDGRLVADVPSMTLAQFVQLYPGDRAVRPPA